MIYILELQFQYVNMVLHRLVVFRFGTSSHASLTVHSDTHRGRLPSAVLRTCVFHTALAFDSHLSPCVAFAGEQPPFRAMSLHSPLSRGWKAHLRSVLFTSTQACVHALLSVSCTLSLRGGTNRTCVDDRLCHIAGSIALRHLAQQLRGR